MFKKGFSFIASLALILTLMAVPAFAETSACTGTADVSAKCDVAKALGSGIDYAVAKDATHNYDVLVSIGGTSTQIWLKTRPTVDNMKVKMKDDGSLDVMGLGTGDSNQWNNLYSKYRTVIVGVSGIGAITMIIFFILNFMKLGASAGNPQARSQALSGVLWTGLAAAGLGAVSIIAGFFYNAV